MELMQCAFSNRRIVYPLYWQAQRTEIQLKALDFVPVNTIGVNKHNCHWIVSPGCYSTPKYLNSNQTPATFQVVICNLVTTCLHVKKRYRVLAFSTAGLLISNTMLNASSLSYHNTDNNLLCAKPFFSGQPLKDMFCLILINRWSRHACFVLVLG